MNYIKPLPLIFVLSFILIACGPPKPQGQANEENAEAQAVEEFDQKSAELQKSWDAVFGKLPPATEVAARIQATGADFMPGLVNDPTNVDLYTEQQDVIVAANLGVYATDVGYLAAYTSREKQPGNISRGSKTC